MSDCCNEFSRASILRRAAAEAGNGLPAIESGMPLPAGTGLTRRSFVSRASGLALAVYGAASLALLAPTGHSRYATLRPGLALTPDEGTPFAEDPSLRWHPSAAALAT